MDLTQLTLLSVHKDRRALFHETAYDDWIDGISHGVLMAATRYDTAVAIIDSELRRPPEAFLHVQSTIHGV